MNPEELDTALSSAPRTARLPHDPWPDIERGIAWRARRRSYRVAAAAAAVLLFGAGGGAGFLAGRGGPEEGAAVAAGDFSPSPAFLAAARVQAAGSDYLAAVAALQRIGRDHPEDDPVAVTQGYEATLALLETVAETVRGAPTAGMDTAPLVAEAARLRRTMDAEVTRLFGAGGAP